jgi:hypothetical protein
MSQEDIHTIADDVREYIIRQLSDLTTGDGKFGKVSIECETYRGGKIRVQKGRTDAQQFGGHSP